MTTPPDGKADVTRRRFLARAGLPAAAAVTAVALPGAAHAEQVAGPSDAPPITLTQLRAMTNTPDSERYFLTDLGMEGLFRYDPADSTASDNTGTIVVTAGGARVKRIFSGPLNVMWFGATGNGQTDDASALQRAVDTGQATGTSVYFPTAHPYYAITKPIVITSGKAAITFFGDGLAYGRTDNGSIIRAHSSITAENPLQAIFRFTDAVFVTHYSFEDLTLIGNDVTKYGIYSAKLAHTRFSRVAFRNTTVAGLAIGYGWCNDILDCVFAHNKGDGITTLDIAVNNINVINTRIIYNGGVGIRMGHTAQGVRISGCQFEQIKSAAIVAQIHVRGMQIFGNYFEHCCSDGYQLTNPDRKIYAYIVLSGTAARGAVGTNQPSGTISVNDNFVAFVQIPAPSYLVAGYCSYGSLEITNNNVIDRGPGRLDTMLLTGTSKTGGGARVDNLLIRGNGTPWYQQPGVTVSTIDVTDLAGATSQLHNATIEGVHRANYAPGASQFRKFSSGRGGAIRRLSNTYRTRDVYELSGAANTDHWGFLLDLADAAELAGKYVYFACYAKVSHAETGPVLNTSQLGDNTSEHAADTDWRIVSYVDKMPTSGSVRFSIAKVSAHASSKLLFTAPVLSEVGVRFDTL